jgi:hypothetical protein
MSKYRRAIEFLLTVGIVVALIFSVANVLNITGNHATRNIDSLTVKSLDSVILEPLPGLDNYQQGEVLPWWIFEGKSGFKVLNQTTQSKQVSLEMNYGLNPCGSEIAYEQTFGKSKEIYRLNSKRSSLISNLSFTLQPLEFVLISIIANGKKCTIATDSRTFIGQVSTKLTTKSPGEFNF